MHVTVCPSCQRKVALPENTSSRTVKTMCPKCGELLPVPPRQSHHPQESVAAGLISTGTATATARDLRTQLGGAFESPRSLGLFVLALGLVSLLVLSLTFCLPTFIEFVGIPVSGVGLLLGLYGLGRAVSRRERGIPYVLAGMAVCGLALVLILSHPWISKEPERSGTENKSPTLLEQRNKELAQ